MDEIAIAKAITDIMGDRLWDLLFQFVIIGTILLLLKNVIEALVSHIMFRIDKHISIGTQVEVYGTVGYIKEVGIFTITVATEKGFIRIPTKMWRFSEYSIIRNHCLDLKRRSTDIKEK